MKRLKQIVSLLLCALVLLCYAPSLSEEETTTPGIPAYRSVFKAGLELYPDGFPNDGAAHYSDLAKLLSRLSLEGTVDTQLMLDPYSRVYMNASVLLDGKELYPFEYDGYYSYRYLRSPAAGKTSMHFQMQNFIEFMLKAYYYLDWPTPWISLALYPEESVYWAKTYSEIIGKYIPEGKKHVSYEELYSMCLELDDLILGETEYRAYYYVTAALVDAGESDRVLSQLGSLENLLSQLDPEQKGLSVTKNGEKTVYTIGGMDILTVENRNDSLRWRFSLTDTDGYDYSVSYEKTNAELHLKSELGCSGECVLSASFDLDGMRAFGDLGGRGKAVLTFGGFGLRTPLSPIEIDWVLKRDSASFPREEELTFSWIHPQTGRKAIGVIWKAAVTEEDRSILKEREYDNQDDLLHMNEGVLDELKISALPSFLLYSLPLVKTIPSGVISDMITFLISSGLLAE